MFHRPINKGLAIACLLSIFILTFIASAHRRNFNVTQARLAAEDTRMTGPCPINVVFNGYITTDSPGPVSYTFVRSDGATGPTREIVFNAAGTRDVSTSWTLGDITSMPHFEGWQAIRILSPNRLDSERANFTLDCSPSVPVSSHGRFRVTLTGFTVNKATVDSILSVDGAGDEVFAMVNFAEILQSNTVTRGLQTRRSLLYGDTSGSRAPFGTGVVVGGQPILIGTGRASTTGGLTDFDRVPDNTTLPVAQNANANTRTMVIPMILWVGELRRLGPNANAVLIIPTIWESDNVPDVMVNVWNRRVNDFMRGFAANTSRFIFDTARRPLIERNTTVLSVIPPRNDYDRPIGMQGDAFNPWAADAAPATFNPWVMLLTFSVAQDASAATSTSGRGVVEIRYRDGTAFGPGDYTMFLLIERLPG